VVEVGVEVGGEVGIDTRITAGAAGLATHRWKGLGVDPPPPPSNQIQ